MKVAVLAEQNFNLIDGSTIWLLNVCKLLALQSDFDIDLVLTHRLESRVLADELPAAITIADAPRLLAAANLTDTQLRPGTLVDVLSAWEDYRGPYDRIFVRGTGYLTRLLAEPAFRGRVVAYAPSAIPDLAEPDPDWVGMGRAARVPVVIQSETARRAMESLFDYPANAVHVVPPIVFPPDDATGDGSGDAPASPPARTGPVTLCYSGKIDLHYGLDWLIGISGEVAADPGLGVSLVAGKDTWRARYRDFFRDMDRFRARIAAGDLPGVSLVANVPHAQAKALMGQADFAYCLRHDRYDDIIEISTKIVEFCTLGVPPILNDNAINRALFGDDYPFLVDITKGDVGARLLDFMRGGRDSPAYAAARARIAAIAAQFAAPRLSESLGRAIRGWSAATPALSAKPRRMLIAAHEFKFLRQFLDRVGGDGNVHVTLQPWASTTRPRGRPQVPADVDTVFCEWCCENAVWHSANKRAGTRLIVRLHRFEAFLDFPSRVNWANVDALIVVSDWFRDRMIDRHGVDPDRIHVMPQYIDWQRLRRPKLPEARFTLGMVGINPFEHKRFDRAVGFLAALRAVDRRFTLAVRSAMPWEIQWVWDREDDTRARFGALFARIYGDPDLAGAIRFDPAGPDMEEWYRGVGTILSSSDSEGCHTSVLEGMASGCYPVVHDWPGARGLFSPHVHEDMTAAIPGLIAFADAADPDGAREALSQRVECHDLEHFTQRLMQL